VKREVLEYLTLVYAAATWDHSLDASALAGRNLLLEACRECVFKGFVKSFLLNYALAQLNSSAFTGTYGATFAAFLASAEAQFQPVRLKGEG
jgi:hypothetical protein